MCEKLLWLGPHAENAGAFALPSWLDFDLGFVADDTL